MEERDRALGQRSVCSDLGKELQVKFRGPLQGTLHDGQSSCSQCHGQSHHCQFHKAAGPGLGQDIFCPVIRPQKSSEPLPQHHVGLLLGRRQLKVFEGRSCRSVDKKETDKRKG